MQSEQDYDDFLNDEYDENMDYIYNRTRNK